MLMWICLFGKKYGGKILLRKANLTMKITANEYDINDILLTFRLLLLSSSVHCELNCCDLAARFLNLYWFKNTNQSWMQTSHRCCLYAFLTCNRSSFLTHDVTPHLKNGVPEGSVLASFSSTSTSLTCQPPSPESMHMLTT